MKSWFVMPPQDDFENKSQHLANGLRSYARRALLTIVADVWKSPELV